MPRRCHSLSLSLPVGTMCPALSPCLKASDPLASRHIIMFGNPPVDGALKHDEVHRTWVFLGLSDVLPPVWFFLCTKEIDS